MANVYLPLQENAKSFLKAVVPFYVPTSNVWELWLFPIFVKTCDVKWCWTRSLKCLFKSLARCFIGLSVILMAFERFFLIVFWIQVLCHTVFQRELKSCCNDQVMRGFCPLCCLFWIWALNSPSCKGVSLHFYSVYMCVGRWEGKKDCYYGKKGEGHPNTSSCICF